MMPWRLVITLGVTLGGASPASADTLENWENVGSMIGWATSLLFVFIFLCGVWFVWAGLFTKPDGWDEYLQDLRQRKLEKKRGKKEGD